MNQFYTVKGLVLVHIVYHGSRYAWCGTPHPGASASHPVPLHEWCDTCMYEWKWRMSKA